MGNHSVSQLLPEPWEITLQMGKEAPERGSGGGDLPVTQFIRAGDRHTPASSSFPGIWGVCVCEQVAL